MLFIEIAACGVLQRSIENSQVVRAWFTQHEAVASSALVHTGCVHRCQARSRRWKKIVRALVNADVRRNRVAAATDRSGSSLPQAPLFVQGSVQLPAGTRVTLRRAPTRGGKQRVHDAVLSLTHVLLVFRRRRTTAIVALLLQKTLRACRDLSAGRRDLKIGGTS